MNKPARPKGQEQKQQNIDYLLCIKDLYEGADPNSELWNKKGKYSKVVRDTDEYYFIRDSDDTNHTHMIPKGDFFNEYFSLNGKYCYDEVIGPNFGPKATTSIVDKNGSILNKDGEIDENIFSRVRDGGFIIEDIYLSGDRKPHKVKRLFTDYAMDEVGFLYNYTDIKEVIRVCEGMPECIQYLVDNNLIEIKYEVQEEQQKKPFKPFIFDLFIESEAMLDDFSIWMKDRDMI